MAVGTAVGLSEGIIGVAVGLKVLGTFVGANVGDSGRQHEIALGGGQLLMRLGVVTSAARQLLDEHTPIVVG